ncbi:UNVERIFIED_CONTAM: hypothetical protein Sradi_2047700 [Sesamum radiatum]|uniref:Uncharacterized protein n=1 Tax=Sesamum radiatum TaxID=300843 RepID=A0AAW2THF2_SESRA
MSAFFRGMTIVVVETAELIRLGTLGSVSPCPGSCYQPFLLNSHESLCDGDRQRGVYNIYPVERGFSVSGVNMGFLGGSLLLDLLTFFSPAVFLGCLSFLHVNVFRCSGQEGVKLGNRLLGQRLEKVPIQEPLGESTGFHFLGGSRHLQCCSIESLLVLLQWLIVFLANGEKTELRLLQLPTASKLVQKERTEFLEAPDGAHG